MNPIFPSKLRAGDEVRIVAPAFSMAVISHANKSLAIQAIEALGLRVTFGQHVDEDDMLHSSSIESRVTDLHSAFSDPNVKAILTVLGGHNSNQLLDFLDYKLIQSNPKIFCGFSDITALGNAIYHKTGLVTYSGLHFSSFAMQKGISYSVDHFKKIFFESSEIELHPSQAWSDDAWYLDQENRVFHPNMGYRVIIPGQAHGQIIGGNLGTLQLLHGTPYMPSLAGVVLFIEEVSHRSGVEVYEFDRLLQSLTQDPSFHKVQALVIGRFENSFKMSEEMLRYILSSKPALKTIPIIANANFGHTSPIFTFPIGGMCSLKAEASGKVKLVIEKH